MFSWFKKKSTAQETNADGQDAQNQQDEKRRYNRRQFLRGSFVRDALDRAVDAAEDTQTSEARQPGHKPVDLLAILGQLDPHSSERQLPPGVDEFNPRPRGTIPIIRPPGAVAEHDFLALCTLCDACTQACPHDSIIAAPARFREAAGTPMIDILDNPCLMCADTPCISACETGALAAWPLAQLSETAPSDAQPPEGPQLEETPPYKIGVALLQQYNCLAYNQSFCTVCAERCPHEGAIELDQGKPRIIAQNCTGCGICHSVCPAPMNAIMVMPNPNRPPAQRLD